MQLQRKSPDTLANVVAAISLDQALVSMFQEVFHLHGCAAGWKSGIPGVVMQSVCSSVERQLRSVSTDKDNKEEHLDSKHYGGTDRGPHVRTHRTVISKS